MRLISQRLATTAFAIQAAESSWWLRTAVRADLRAPAYQAAFVRRRSTSDATRRPQRPLTVRSSRLVASLLHIF